MTAKDKKKKEKLQKRLDELDAELKRRLTKKVNGEPELDLNKYHQEMEQIMQRLAGFR